MILQFSETLMFLVVIIIVFMLAIAVAVMFKIESVIVVLILFGLIIIFLYLYGVLPLNYGAIGFVVVAITTYIVFKVKGVNEI